MIQLEITATEVGTTEQVVTLVEIAGAGPQGPAGDIPDGGLKGYALVKASNADQDIEWSPSVVVDRVTFETDAALEPTAEGELVWDAEAGTIDLAMGDGVLQRVGEDMFYRVQADEAISKGDLVMAVGTLGNSGVIVVAKARPTYEGNDFTSQQLMGLAPSDIAQGEKGYIVAFGRIRRVDTSAYSEGDILFADPTTPGGLTPTRPEAPNWKTIAALVITQSATVGTLQVRLTFGSNLGNDELVNLNGIADDHVLRYDATAERFEAEPLGSAADAQVSDFATAAQGSLADTATQPGDNISTLTNDANYIDAAGAPVQSVDGFTGVVDLATEYDALGSASAVQSNLNDHEGATTNVHGIADTSQLIVEGDARLTDERTPTDGSVTDAKIVAGGLSPSSVTGTAVIDSDARLSDERTPVDGSVTSAKIDPAGLAPSDIAGTAVIDSDARLTDERTPLDGSVTTAKIDAAGISPASVAGTAVIDGDARLSDERTPLDGSVTDAKVSAGAAIQQSKIDGLTASLSGKANLVAGKVPQSELPAIAFTEVDVVPDISARDALTVQEGDVAIVQDAGAGESITYIYDGTAWQEILTPTGGITNVTGSQGLNSTGGTTPDIFIVDGGVTNAKLAGNIAPSKITGTAVVDSDARLSEGAPASETVRSLGTGSTQALPGDYDVAGEAPVQSVDGLTGTVDLSGEYDTLGSASAVQSNLTTHINDATNPHNVDKAQVGLGNVDNTSDLDKPISTATQSALSDKADEAVVFTAGVGLDGGGDLSANRTFDLDTATQLSLSKADTATQPGDNVSTLTNDAGYIDAAGAPVQSVNAQTGAVVLDKADVGLGAVPNLDTTDAVNKAHDQNTDTSLAFGTLDAVTATEIRGHIDATDNPHGVTASQVGLGNVDNTADLDKPVSTATQSALDDKADNTITVTGTSGIEGGGDLTANRALALTAATLASLSLADTALQSGDPATDVAYDNTASGLSATTVQGAIDEIVGILNNVLELNTGS